MILVADHGGSGTFSYPALVINDNGTAKPVASMLLADRVVVKYLAIQHGKVIVTLLTRTPDESMSAEPKRAVTRRFTVQNDTLVEAKHQ